MTQHKEHQFPVMEIFGPTIQGEGALAGHLTHFIRLGGCGHRCTWCDTMWAVDPRQVRENRTMMTAVEIRKAVEELGYAPWITFSGGDPCIHKHLDAVINELQEDYFIAVETQGAVWQDWLYDVDLVTLSPKGPSSGMEHHLGDFPRILENFASNDESITEVTLKIVVDPEDEADYQFALTRMEDFRDTMVDAHPCYLQPCSPVGISGGQHKVLEILRRYQMLCTRVFESTNTDELPVQDVVVLPQLHALTWPDQDKGI